MSYSLNKCQLIGNVTRDPELKQTRDGKVLARVTVATSVNWKTADGEKKTKTEFHNVVIFGNFANTVSQFLRKGDKVYVEGMVETSSWEDDNGVKKYKTEIISKNMMFLDAPKGSNDSGNRGLDLNLSDNEF